MMSWASISREAKKRKTKKKTKNAGDSPRRRGPGVKAQGPAGYYTDQIRPRSIQIRPLLWLKSSRGGQKTLRRRFWLENQDLGASVGAIGMVFRDLSGRSRPDSKNPGKKLRFLSCLFIKGAPMANSYTPYKRPAPI